MTDLLSNDPAEDWEHALFHCTEGDLPALRQQWLTDMDATFQRYEPRRKMQAGQQNPSTAILTSPTRTGPTMTSMLTKHNRPILNKYDP